MVTCHCKMFESSTKPAEKPSIGFRVKSVSCFKRTSRITPHRQRGVSSRKGKKETPPVRDLTTRYERKEKLDCPPRPFCPRRSGSVRCIITGSSRTKKNKTTLATRLRSSHLSVDFAAKSPLDCSFETVFFVVVFSSFLFFSTMILMMMPTHTDDVNDEDESFCWD